MAGAPDFSILSSGNARARTDKAGDVVFREGDAADEMYVIKTGTIEIRVGNRVLEKLGENTIFGEMALIDSSRRSADAVAVTDATIIPVTEKQFLRMVSQTHRFLPSRSCACWHNGCVRQTQQSNDCNWRSQSLNPGIGITQSQSNGFRQPCENQNTDGRIRAGALVEPAAREHVKIGIPFGVHVGRSCFIIDKSQFSEKTALAHGCQMAVVSCNGQQDSNATPPDKKHLVAGITGRKESLFPL